MSSRSVWASTGPFRPASRRITFAIAFVIAALAALLVVPLLGDRRAEALRVDIEDIADPARHLTARLELAAAWEAAAIRGYLLTGDERFLDLYRQARTEEERALSRLVPLVYQLEPEMMAPLREIQRLAPRWHRLQDQLLRGEITPAQYRAQLPDQQELYAATLNAAMQLEQQIARSVELRRSRIRAIEREGRLWTMLLAGAAVLAAAIVAGLAARQRRLVRYLDAQAREEEALRVTAEDLTEPLRVEEVLHRIAARALLDERAEGAYVEQVDRDTGEVEVAAVAGEGTPERGVRVPFPGSLSEEKLLTREPEQIADLSRDLRPTAVQLPATGAKSALVLPLLADGRILGALVVLSSRAREPLPPATVERARIFADLAALALRRALLLQEAEQRRDEAVSLAEALRQQVESKSRLMRGVSHDVKNPLGAVLGYAELLEDGIYGELTPTQREGVERIRSAVGSALSLIEDLLELARAEEGRLEVERISIDLGAVLRTTIDEYRAAISASGLTLESAIPELPELWTDPDRVRQILGNLLTNAAKYTPRGGHVRVDAEVVSGRRAGDPEQWIAVRVTDTGPGVPEERQAEIFEEFTRLARTGRGAGVGLAISYSIAQLLGGDLSVASEVGHGAVFTLRLPVPYGP